MDAAIAADYFYKQSAEQLDGSKLAFSSFKDKAVMVVNTASKCGYTPQYAALEKVYQKYKDQGFTVVAFPSPSFNQEPLSDAEAAKFCKLRYGVTFPVMKKVSVTGKDAHPIFEELTKHSSDPQPVQWNFEKFVINRKGELVGRFPSKVKPDSSEVTKVIEMALKK